MTRSFVCVFAVIVVFALQSYSQDVYAIRRAAAKALISGQYSEALKILNPILNKSTRDPALWTLRGLALNGLGETAAAIADFNRALRLNNVYVPALEAASQATYAQKDSRAAGYTRRLLEEEPRNRVANAIAGVLAYEAKNCGSSIRYFEKSDDEVYQNDEAISEFADCLLQRGLPGRAVQVLTKGTKEHPQSTQLKYNLALVELENHNPEQAIQILNATDAKSDSGLLSLLARAYSEAHLPDDAFRTLEDAIRADPKQESNYFDLAVLCLDHNREQKAVDIATFGIVNVPKASSLFLIRGVAYAQLGVLDKAGDDLLMSAKFRPDQPQSTIAMSLLYSDQNQPGKEKAMLIAQLKRSPNDAAANFLLANLLLRQGARYGTPEYFMARSALEKSLAQKPRSEEAQLLMGNLLEQEDRLEDALEHYQLALKADPDSHTALYNEFKLLHKLHRDKESTNVLNRLKDVIKRDTEGESASIRVGANPSFSNSASSMQGPH